MSDHEVPRLISPASLESQIQFLESHDDHISISRDALDSWVQQRFPDFATCVEPPPGLLESGVIEEGMSDIERDAMTRWFAPVIRNPTEVEVGPGYICGLALERIGTKLLYGTKISILVGKCLYYTRPWWRSNKRDCRNARVHKQGNDD
ncbi:hypothetical protein BU17DRAFT_72802 [Hysterangium stoloniferum]|nr:hypothetical protein BU17DRAFT_72802 [Hysterangium stoloniferum]